jgi:hypothetical protein
VGLAVMLIGFAASVLTDDTGLTDIIGGEPHDQARSAKPR